MGVGRGVGDDRVTQAVKSAIESPLLETSIAGAKAVLLNVTGGYDLGMLEVNEASDQIAKAAHKDAMIIFGTSVKEEMHDEIVVTVIATGFEDRPKNDIFMNNKLNSEEESSEPLDTDGTEAGGDLEEKNETLDRFDKKYTTDFVIPEFLKGSK